MNISVIIPVYNAERFLEKAVKSALQFPEVKEVLLCEDRSPDGSLEICKKLEQADQRVRTLQHADKGNHGAGATRNLGLDHAAQDFIAFLDADDYFLANRFDAEKELFKDPKIEGVFGALGTEFLSEKGQAEFKDKFGDIRLTTAKYPVEGRQIFYDLLGYKPGFGTFFHLDTLTVRKAALNGHHLRFNEKLRVHQDQDFITKLAYHCHLKSGNITEAIAVRGVHDDNRITKIKSLSKDYKNKQKLVWESLHAWAKDKPMTAEYKTHIKRQMMAYQIAVAPGTARYAALISNILRDYQLLRTRYRYIYL